MVTAQLEKAQASPMAPPAGRQAQNGFLVALTALVREGEGSTGLLGSGVLGRGASRNQGQGAWGCPHTCNPL